MCISALRSKTGEKMHVILVATKTTLKIQERDFCLSSPTKIRGKKEAETPAIEFWSWKSIWTSRNWLGRSEKAKSQIVTGKLTSNLYHTTQSASYSDTGSQLWRRLHKENSEITVEKPLAPPILFSTSWVWAITHSSPIPGKEWRSHFWRQLKQRVAGKPGYLKQRDSATSAHWSVRPPVSAPRAFAVQAGGQNTLPWGIRSVPEETPDNRTWGLYNKGPIQVTLQWSLKSINPTSEFRVQVTILDAHRKLWADSQGLLNIWGKSLNIRAVFKVSFLPL